MNFQDYLRKHFGFELDGDSELWLCRDMSNRDLQFEDKRLKTTDVPTIVSATSLERGAAVAESMCGVLETIIDVFLSDLRSFGPMSPIVQFFAPYRKYFPLIAAEQRTSRQISLMRYDALEPSRGSWRFLETNTHCPGGVIHCALLRRAWLDTKLGREIAGSAALRRLPMDSPDTFLQHLIQQAQEFSQREHPTVLLGNYRGVYSNELTTLVGRHRELLLQGHVCGQLLVGDVANLHVDKHGRCSYQEHQVDMIYNKLDPLMIDFKVPALQGWIEAATSPHVEFLNGLGASYLTEAKRILAFLWAPSMLDALGLNDQLRNDIQECIPRTWVLGPGASAEAAIRNKDTCVLKPDALTRGAGVVLGRECTADAWSQVVHEYTADTFVVQEFVDAPTKPHSVRNLEGAPQHFYGVDLFLLQGTFAGAVSRSHTSRVFNVGNDGAESPLLVVDDREYLEKGSPA